jgi:hypothetical protein
MAWFARWRRHPVALALFLLGLTLVAVDVGCWVRARVRAIDRGDYAPRSDWEAPNRGGTHTFAYVFRDRDRDGRFDLGDRPMAWVAVELTAPDGRRTILRSNLAGFANFDMSRFRRGAPVHAPGEHTFRTLVPQGWVLTTRNALQRARMVSFPGAPADLVVEDPPGPVGLAPALSLTGRCVRRGPDGSLVGAADGEVDALGPGGKRLRLRVGADGTFSTPAVPGRWQLTIQSSASAAPLRREVEVRDAPVVVGGLPLGEPAPALMGPLQSLDFESITGATIAKIPAGVGGLEWDYLHVLAVTADDPVGYANTLSSGRYVAYGSAGQPVTLTRPGGFDFRGAYLGAAQPEAEGETLRAQAYRGGRLVADDEAKLSALGPVWLDADYRQVDRVVLSTRHYWHFAMDDMAFSTGAAATGASRQPGEGVSSPPRRDAP